MRPNNPRLLIPIGAAIVLVIFAANFLNVYLLFDRDAEWKEQPPVPAFLMDQIGLENGKPFDGDELAEQIRVFLSANPK